MKERSYVGVSTAYLYSILNQYVTGGMQIQAGAYIHAHVPHIPALIGDLNLVEDMLERRMG